MIISKQVFTIGWGARCGGPGDTGSRVRARALRHVVGSAVIGFGLVAATTAAGAELVELHKWFSAGRLDNSTTTHPSWRGAPGQTRSPDYRFSAVEGRILAPGTAPAGTVPLHRWYSPGRGDNTITSHPSWHGRAGETRSPDYRYSRLEGYAFGRPLAGTIPLVRWYDATRGDNHSTTHPSWLPAGRPGETRSPDYASHRIDGWIHPPAEGMLARGHDPARFGYGSRAVAGTRPLLVILLEFDDVRLSEADDFYERLVFGPGEPNLAGYFRAMSNGSFAWSRADVVRVLIPQDASDAVASSDLNQRIMRAVADQGFDYARYDADRDGKLGRHELGVLRLVSDYYAPHTAGGQNAGLPTMTVSGIQLSGLQSANCNEYGDLKLLAHELIHQLGVGEHVYGPGRALNDDATPMASSDDRRFGGGPVALDPFSAMVLGWMEPRVVPITAAGGVASLAAAQHAGGSAGADTPVLFYDPNRSLQEYFVVQYRTPSTGIRPDGGYDAEVRRRGIAVWYVQRDANGQLVTFDWPPPVRPKPGGDMFAGYYVGPQGPGVGRFWTAADGEFGLAWGDGADSKLRLRVAPISSTASHAALQWRHADQPFLPRIDEVAPTAARPGKVVVLNGTFPVTTPATDPVQVVLAGPGTGGRSLPLEIRSRTASRILARLPAAIADGSYLLTVRSEAGRPATGGNGVRLRVAAEGS